MHDRPTRLAWLAWLLLLGSCGSPPKPPSVDETHRRPVNSTAAIELHGCRNELHNSRLLSAASTRQAQTWSASLARWAAGVQRCESATAEVAANQILSVPFEFASTQVVLPADTGAALVNAARAAPLVLLRGRTDGERNSPAESRIAHARAQAVRDYLVAGGVDARRIRMTYQPVGDHVSENVSAAGRQLNRRVEIELYAVLPVVARPSRAAS